MSAQRLVPWIVPIAVAVAVIAVSATLLLSGGEETEREVVTVRVDGPDPDPVRDDTLTVPERAVEQVARTDAGDHDGLRREPRDVSAPPGVPVPESTTLAAPEQAGCLTRLVRNQSSRNGASPRLFVLHYTVSPNRPGRSDVDGITAYFNGPSSQASSHYVVDAEGHCNLIVAESAKAWTQGSFNPVSISVEQINTGSESSYAGTAGLLRLAVVVSDSTRRWRIPLRQGATSGCSVTRPGVVDHDSLGCGNNHTDVKPFAVSQVVRAAGRYRYLRARNDRLHPRVRRCRGRRSGGCRRLRRRHRVVHAALGRYR